MAGWIKLHRKIQKHWLFSFNEPDKALAFIDLVLSASFDDGTVMIKGRTYTVKRGQFLVAQTTLQNRWKWSQNKVKRFLNLLKNERMVELETDERTSIITICNYLDYQGDELADERASERTGERSVERATNEQSNDIKRSKEPKNKRTKDSINISENLDFSEWPQQPNSEILKAWLVMRKRVKASCSQLAMNTIGNELHKAVDAGWSVDECLRQSEAASWKGFKASWMKREDQRNGYQNSTGLNRHERLQQWSVDATASFERQLAEIQRQEDAAAGNVGEQEFIPYLPDVDS